MPEDRRVRFPMSLDFSADQILALESTQPLTEMSTRNLPAVRGGREARKADNLTAICEPIV
jgi:hypothetical protein